MKSRLPAIAAILSLLLIAGPASASGRDEAQGTDAVAIQDTETRDQSEGKKTKETEADRKKEHVLDEIVVTATRTEKALSDVPAAVTVVTREDIENKNTQTIDGALQYVPGVFDKRAKGLDTTARVTLRGIPDQKRTLALMDGMPLNDGYTSVVNWNGILPENVERVEVARGPFSSLYGGNAMGGVINIITRMPETREVMFKGGYGSDNFWTSYGSYGDKYMDRLSLFASYGYKASDGYPSDLAVKTPTSSGVGVPVTGAIPTTDTQGNPAFIIGDRGDNSYWRDSANFKLAYDLTDSSKLTFSFMRSNYEYDYGDPHSFLKDENGNTLWSGYAVIGGLDPKRISVSESNFLTAGGGRTLNLYNAGYEGALFGNVVVKAKCGLIDNEKDWYVTPSSTALRDSGAGKISETPSTAFFSELQFTVPILEKHFLTFGAGYRYDQAETEEFDLLDWRNRGSKDDLTFNSKGKDGIYSFFGQAEIALWKNVTAYVGIRGDYWETYDGMVDQVGMAGYPQTFGSRGEFAASPKGSLVYKPFESTTLRSSVGTAFRPPNVYELYRTWIYYGTTYAGNPNLGPERSFSYDFGVEQAIGKNSVLKVTYFHNQLEDLIYRQDVTPTLKELINVGEAETEGVEVEAEARLHECFKAFAAFTYTRSEMISNPAKPETEGRQLTGIPERVYTIGGEFTRGPLLVSLTGRFADKQYNTDENLDVVSGVYGSYDAYFVTDLFVRYQVNKWAAVSFAVDNLLDERYYSYYRAPGRQFYGGVTVKF